MKILWATDIHIDHCTEITQRKFFAKINNEDADMVVITGDITQGNYFERDMELLSKNIRKPIKFCLGNHDCYFSSIAEIRTRAANLGFNNMDYLSTGTVFSLTSDTALIGHDGFYDARLGTPNEREQCQLADFSTIGELKYLFSSRTLLVDTLNKIGDEIAAYFADLIPKAFNMGYKKLIVATHVPPFEKAAKYMGKVSEPNFLPFFSCKAVGDVLTKEMHERPSKEMLVLCGHTHDKADVKILPNLHVRAGKAIYGSPRFELLEV